jgi:hypothetical protein
MCNISLLNNLQMNMCMKIIFEHKYATALRLFWGTRTA